MDGGPDLREPLVPRQLHESGMEIQIGLYDFPHGRFHDEGAAMDVNDHQALGCKNAKRLPDGSAADAQAFGGFGFHKPLAELQISFEYGLSNRSDDVFR